MFCTKCGKKLYDEDRFCAHCGAEVRQERRSRYDDVVFNPPFKVEAQRRTEAIVKSTDEQKAEKRARETVSFDWNLDGFPAAKPKKTEEVDFNWDSVIEKRNSSRGIQVEKIQFEPEVFFAPLKSSAKEEPEAEAVIPEPVFAPEPEEPVMTVEELEKELFAYDQEHPSEVVEPTVPYELSKRWSQEVPAVTDPAAEPETAEPEPAPFDLSELEVQQPAAFTGDSRFYTYNQKFDAFQELLEREREKLKNMEDEYNKDMENLDYTWVGEVFPELLSKEEVPAEPEQDKEPEKEPEVVGVSSPYRTMSIDIASYEPAAEEAEAPAAEAEDPAEPETVPEAADEPEEAPAEAEAEVQEQEETPSKTKLRYSDIFPRGLVDDDGSSGVAAVQSQPSKEKIEKASALSSIYDDIDEDDEPKKHLFAKIIIGILIALVLAEGVLICVKLAAPESKLSLWSNDMLLKVVDMISGDGDDPQGAGDDEALYKENEKDVYMSGLIDAASSDMKTIGETGYNADLTFDSLSTYYFDEIPQADPFVDADWFQDNQGQTVTYGQRIMEALIRYYDSWQSVNDDTSLVGINRLETGEIRTGTEGFYVLCKITYAGADGGEAVKHNTVYLRISDETMIINEIKEGN